MTDELIGMRQSTRYRRGLKNMIKYIMLSTEVKTMAEVGSYAGESSCIFAHMMSDECIIYCVDPWLQGYDESDIASSSPMDKVENTFDENTSKFSNIKKIKKLSSDACLDFEDESLDFVYIDAMHTYEGVRDDIIKWYPKVKNGYYIGGHDYNSGFRGVKRAILELLGVPEETFRDKSWVVKKTPELTKLLAQRIQNLNTNYGT